MGELQRPTTGQITMFCWHEQPDVSVWCGEFRSRVPGTAINRDDRRPTAAHAVSISDNEIRFRQKLNDLANFRVSPALLACADFVGAPLIRMPVIRDARMVQMRVKVVDEFLERRMPGKTLEVILLHFCVGLICGPAIVRHAKDGSHGPGTMPAALTVNEHGLVGRVVHKF